MAITPWEKDGEPQILAQGFGKSFVRQRYKDHKKKERDFFFFEQPSWSSVLALTVEDKVVMVRQFKQGSGTVTEEIPGGTADFTGEDPQVVVERELFEEAGYKAGRVIPLGNIWMNSRNSHTQGHLFVAVDCCLVGAVHQDEEEQLEVFLISFREFARRVFNSECEHQMEVSTVFLRALPHLKTSLRFAAMREWLRFFFRSRGNLKNTISSQS